MNVEDAMDHVTKEIKKALIVLVDSKAEMESNLDGSFTKPLGNLHKASKALDKAQLKFLEMDTSAHNYGNIFQSLLANSAANYPPAFRIFVRNWVLLNKAVVGASMKTFTDKLVNFLLPEMRKAELGSVVQVMQY